MFVLTLTAIVLVRYYLKQREAVNALALQLRDDVVADAKAAAGALYAGGVKARELYETYAPKVIAFYQNTVAAVKARFA